MTTALFIERDASYVPMVRKLRGTMARQEWDHPGYRAAALKRAWDFALAHIKQSDPTAEFLCPLPVTLYCAPVTGAVIVADISRDGVTPTWITATGDLRIVPPLVDHAIVRRTTYAHWAEGPLPHLEMELLSAPTPHQDREVQRLRAQNRAIRDKLDAALAPNNWAAAPASFDPGSMANLIDFRVRGVFRVRDHRVIESKQSDSAKLRITDGMIDFGEDGQPT